MLTKEKILEVLERYSQVLDDYLRGVTSWEYDAIADALLSLQEAPPEKAIPEGYITEQCPDGYVAKEIDNPLGCDGCWFSNMRPCPGLAPCIPIAREDNKMVIFIRKEDIQ